MIKFFKNEDVVFTKYSVSNKKTSNNIVPNDLLAGTTGNFNFPIKLDILECDHNKSGSCDEVNVETSYFLKISNDLTQTLDFQIGKKINDDVVFYDTSSIYYNSFDNPINKDGSYKGQVYNTTKKMYYNDYNNSYNQFGFDGYDTSKATLNLSNEFSSLKLKISETGNKILPKSVRINNQSGDIVADIIDDGNNNLILSGSFFINKTEIKSESTNLTIPMNAGGLGRYILQNGS